MALVQLLGNIDRTFVNIAGQRAGTSIVDDFTAHRPSVRERREAGKKLRDTVPRSSHSAFRRLADTVDPLAILDGQNRARAQKLIPVRYARMLASPFAFLRGSAAVMAADLSTTPVTGLAVAACGDMHVSNFGVFASAERNLIFAINDFDEVYPGPWEWDLKRLAASAAVAVRFQGGGRTEAEEAARRCVRSYRRRMARYAEMGNLEIWYDRIDERSVLDALGPKGRRNAQKLMDKARAKGHQTVLEKLTERGEDGEHRIIEDVPLIVRETHTSDGMPVADALNQMLVSYVDTLPVDRQRLLARYRIVDSVRKVVGVGSVGTGCWVVLLRGIDDEDPLFLQVKQAQTSVLAPYVDFQMRLTNQGERVVTGQRLIQGSPDIFLGWGAVGDAHFYVRQLADMKGSVKFTDDDADTPDFDGYCSLCGWALALAHAKSGDPAMIAGYCGNSAALDEAIGKFALAYLEQTERDHETLDRARREGRIEVAAEAVT